MKLMDKATNSEKIEWAITTNRFVAFIDIMGFKDMVLKMPHEDIYKLMKVIDEAKTLNSQYADKEKFIRTTTYSDSIMLYTIDASYKSFDALTSAVSGLTNDLFIGGIPHKGAIAYGKMTLDDERAIFFGQPLIDAYLLQEELHFYGIILHGNVEEQIGAKINTTSFVMEFECPLKNGRSNHYTVYPMHVDIDSANSDDFKEYHEKITVSLQKMRYKTSGHLRRYIDNTESYFSHVKNN